MRHGLLWRRSLLSIVMLLPLGGGGCQMLGAAANALPQGDEPAAYKDLQNHRVTVMVWVDPGIRTDYSRLQLDTAGAIQEKLKGNAKASKEELKGTVWPYEPRSVVRYQLEHPETEAMPIADVATKLPTVTRLLYVEIESFSLHAENLNQLFRGSATATLKVVEVLNGQAKIGYEEHDIRALFPPKAPPEGVPGDDPQRYYRGTVDALATQIANRFVAHEGEK